MALQAEESRRKMLTLWNDIHVKKNFGNITISNEILQSWERCKKYNVDQFKRTAEHVLSAEEFKKLKYINKSLIETVLPAMKDIYATTKGTGFNISLTEANGYCLAIIGDPNSLEFAKACNMIEGSNWSEEYMGTNSHSLSMQLNKPVQVYGYEHYCKCASLATCCGAPIRDTNNKIIATLNLSGPYELFNPHTLGMVYSVAKSIEREFQLKHLYKQTKKLYNETNLTNAHMQAVLKSMSEGVITIDTDNIITLANDNAYRLLNLNNENLIGRNINILSRNEQNPYFVNSIMANKQMAEEAITITINNKSHRYIVNTNYMFDKSKKLGTIIVFREFNKVANKFVRLKTNVTFDNLIGKNPYFLHAIEEAKMAAATDSNVLLLGESGVGKDLFAQAIHNASTRKNETFVPVNCAAIPRELITSELFGYEEGAFTGARKGGNPGKFELADQGTLFLDEIGEMPLDIQATLLRVLEDKNIIRLGGKESIPLNVRLISATNKQLLDDIDTKLFRRDLFFRLQVITINIPALRERKDDIPLLFEYIIDKISNNLGKNIKTIKPDVMDIIMQYNWPGNVRELRNIAERCINLTREGIIHVDLLPSYIIEKTIFRVEKWKRTTSTKQELEENLIRTYLTTFRYNKTQVAEAMNISRSSLYRKMFKYNIK